MSEEIEYLNYILREENKHAYSGPKTLFRYRSFNENNLDSLLKDYVFLCPAENLDDETECMATINLSDIVEYETNGLNKYFVGRLLSMIKPHCSKDVFNQIYSVISMYMDRNGAFRNNQLLEAGYEISQLVPDFDETIFVNVLKNSQDISNDPNKMQWIEKLINLALDARKNIGVCSLSKRNDIEKMWQKYADNETGYCIEYDLSNYDNPNVFPVIYGDERETNVIIAVTSMYVGILINAMSNNQLQGDISEYFRLFLSKLKKWEYQEEWRILGDANARIKAPTIKRIILGKNASENNAKIIRDYCLSKSIEFIQR